MNTGANIEFMATETQKATSTFCQHIGPARNSVAPVSPMYSRNAGVPDEKMIIAMLMPMPRMPQTSIFDIRPKPL